MNKKILITGAKGFLGQNVSKYFKKLGYATYGIGHGNLLVDECRLIGLDYWYKSDVKIDAIRDIKQKFDVIVHCGGSGSVGFSVENPYQDFKKTVDGTLEVLEYIRLYNPKVHFIYPSSPAVQGECPDRPISEDYLGKPASPYGYHKKIAEDLCRSYSSKYNIKVTVIRFFSIYGNGLQKQLLWDACNKLYNAKEIVEFWGKGDETRDWIYVSDAVELIYQVATSPQKYLVINGGSGRKYTIRETLLELNKMLNKEPVSFCFNNNIRQGDPKFYCADISRAIQYNWSAKISLEEGLKQYVQWFKAIRND